VVREPSEPPSVASTRKPARIDGRHLRSERTKRLIVEAYMALVRESAQMPTAVQIADRAGYSVRSIFERFPDLSALRVTATDYAIAEAKEQYTARDVDGDRLTRIRSQVEIRARSCERWLSLWRVLTANRDESPELQQRVSTIRDLIIERMELMFRLELSTLSEGDRHKTLLAIEAITDFESWARMIEMFGLSHEQARQVWVKAIDRLLPPTPPLAPANS